MAELRDVYPVVRRLGAGRFCRKVWFEIGNEGRCVLENMGAVSYVLSGEPHGIIRNMGATTTVRSSRRRGTKKRAPRGARAAAIHAGFGRFRDLGISSADYAAEKRREVEREDRRR